MTYFVSLKIVAIILGVLLILGHLPAALMPEKVGPWIKSSPRNYPLGVGLMILATLWFVVLTGVMDLGEISNLRLQLMGVWTVGGVLMMIFVPGFLAARAVGCLLLLAAALLLDATFLALTPTRYVLTLLAYAWVIAGMVLVYSPHLGRDAVMYVTATPNRLRSFAGPGVLFGILVLILGIFVYPAT